MNLNFKFASSPDIYFGNGNLGLLPGIIRDYGSKVLLITGRSSFLNTPGWNKLVHELEKNGIQWYQYTISDEPSPEMIDNCVLEHNIPEPDVIVSIGGGSVMDAGKAISAMWKVSEPIRFYLEGVGDGRVHPGTKIPFIAVPTTSGTGSEATKNAVISEIGENGFKKSLRHNHFIPDLALVDPELILNCPENITAWSGMDAFTQLLESYLSPKGNPLTDTIAQSGLRRIAASLEKVVFEPDNLKARSDMAYAALCSGITLANAGLGTIHGFASSIGGKMKAPHGLICGTLMGTANEFTLNKLLKNNPDHPALKKYTEAGRLFYGSSNRDDVFYAEFLINKIHDLTEKFRIPGLGQFGLEEEMIKKIAAKTSNKNNPVEFTVEELSEILRRRL